MNTLEIPAEFRKQDIIDMLIVDAKTDREHGYNAALIAILKGPKNDLLNLEKAKLKSCLGISFNKLNDTDFMAVLEEKNKGNKLMAIKLLRNVTGLDIRTLKDMMDEYFNSSNQ